MRDNKYEPFKKENATIKYINNESNHPKTIIKSINQIKDLVTYQVIVFNDRVKTYNEAVISKWPY